jgi:hypothetical protein
MDVDALTELSSNIGDIPQRLKPIIVFTRTTLDSQRPTYKDLTSVILSVEEKNWLCREVLGTNDVRYDQIKTKKGLISRYGLHDGFFKKNLKTFAKNGSTNAPCCPPVSSTPAEYAEIAKEITKKRVSINEMTMGALKEALTDQKVKRQRTNGVAVSEVIPVDKRTVP